MRRLLDALLAQLARLAVRLTTRRLEVIDGDRIPRDRPVLVVANHFNGFADPLVVVAVLGRLPRFMAKATLWKLLPLRPLLRLGGIIPVHRRVDGGGGGANDRSFAAAEAGLLAGQTVAIFPEGITHDEPRLAELRTGAARIALGARATGAKDLCVVPVGLLFEDKVAIRTRVLARVGRPIELDAAMRELDEPDEPDDETNREAVRRLTDLVTERLREVCPDYADRWQHAELGLAADVALRPEPRARHEPIPLVDRERVAQRLADSDATGHVLDATERYATRLHLVDADDNDLLAHGGVIGWTRQLLTAGLLLFLGYVLLAPALVFSTIPALLVILAGAQARSPVSKGTTRVLVGFVAFLTTWIIVAVNAADTGLLRVAWVAYQIAAVAVALPILEYSLEWVRATRSWWHLRDHRARIPELLEDRAALVSAVEAATARRRRARTVEA
jgi:glycerol-3-phosphate O-acyltransferase/dihydroxyacetone phosphate acyltransferase